MLGGIYVSSKHYPCRRFRSNAAMDRWHDLKLPRRAYLDFMQETLWMD